MNTEEFLRLLTDALRRFLVHPNIIGEIVNELKRSGNETAFFRILLTRLSYLADTGILATKHEEFEPLARGIYSMHLAGKGFNIRILYAFTPRKRPVLLMAFHERAGHKATDYSGKIAAAVDRLSEIKEDSL